MKYIFLLSALVLGASANAQVNSFDIDSSRINRPLKAQLDSIYQADQAPRFKFLEARQKNEAPERVDSLRKIMLQHDQENLAKCIAILEKHGW
jgi:hypothetical protein